MTLCSSFIMKTKTLEIKIYCRFQRHARPFFRKVYKIRAEVAEKRENLNKRVLSHFSCACRCTKCHKLVFEDSSMSCDFNSVASKWASMVVMFYNRGKIKHDHHPSFHSNPHPFSSELFHRAYRTGCQATTMNSHTHQLLIFRRLWLSLKQMFMHQSWH